MIPGCNHGGNRYRQNHILPLLLDFIMVVMRQHSQYPPPTSIQPDFFPFSLPYFFFSFFKAFGFESPQKAENDKRKDVKKYTH